MDRHQPLDGLEFQYDLILDDNVEPISAFQSNRLINDGKRYLTLVGQTVMLELEAQAFFVGRFQKARSELAVDIYCEADEPPRSAGRLRAAPPSNLTVSSPHW